MRPIEKVIQTLNQHLIELHTQCVADFRKAGQAYLKMDVDAASQVIDTQDQFEESYSQFEEACLKVLALHQPVAGDLRMIMGLFKIGQDVERIHSLTERIGKKTRKIAQIKPVEIPSDSGQQVEVVEKILNAGLRIIEDPNVSQSEVIQYGESESSRLKKSLREKIETEIMSKPDDSRVFMLMMGVSRHLDRIAKLVVAITEEQDVLQGR